jgi:RNA polymerase sigma factor (sigma-70 family)
MVSLERSGELGSSTWWGGLVELEPLVRGTLARRHVPPADLDDLVQETFLRAARFRARGSAPEKLGAWVMRIALNVLHDRARRELRLAGPEALAEAVELDALVARESLATCVGEPGDERWVLGGYVVTRDGALEALAGALDDLRSEESAILRCYYAEEQRSVAAARACGQPESLAKLRLYRARRRLSRALEPRLERAARHLERVEGA